MISTYKKNFEIAIRCNSNKSKGFGNFRRCLILYFYLKKKNKNSLFLIDNDIEAKNILKKENISFEIISNTHHKDESKQIHQILQKYDISKIVLDVRENGESLAKKLQFEKLIIISIDDAWIKNVFSDIIINVTGIKKYSNYKIKYKYSKSFSGDEFFITDENFCKHKKLLSSIHSKKNFNVTITMGGSDPNDLTQWILKILLKNIQIHLTVILGPFYNKPNLLKNTVANYPNCKLVIAPKNIWNIFKNSDLVITNAGSTLFELSIQGIPNLSIIAFKHQKPYAEYFHKKGATINLGFKSTISKTKLKNTVLQLLNNNNKRKTMCKLGPKIVDGKGTQRVCSIILETKNSKDKIKN